MKDTLRIIAASALITGLLVKAVPALAEPALSRAVSVVRTGDLNLGTAKGQRELDRRLVIAAGEVCGAPIDVDPAGRNDIRLCRQSVLTEARAQSEALIAARATNAIIQIATR
jgi:UrcA family protein